MRACKICHYTHHSICCLYDFFWKEAWQICHAYIISCIFLGIAFKSYHWWKNYTAQSVCYVRTMDSLYVCINPYPQHALRFYIISYLCNAFVFCLKKQDACIKKRAVSILIFIALIHSYVLYRGSYMSAHVLLNLLNELEKRDKMRGLPSILSLFRNEFNKFNNTRARMLDSIYHMIKSHFCRKNVIILSLCTQRCYGRHNVSRKSINH